MWFLRFLSVANLLVGADLWDCAQVIQFGLLAIEQIEVASRDIDSKDGFGTIVIVEGFIWWRGPYTPFIQNLDCGF